jgi:hypothetical protein
MRSRTASDPDIAELLATLRTARFTSGLITGRTSSAMPDDTAPDESLRQLRVEKCVRYDGQSCDETRPSAPKS